MSKNKISKTSESLTDMQQAVLEITKERGWCKYHTPKNMAMDLVREASEVLEHFIWESNEEIVKDKKRKRCVEDELSDVLHAVFLLADIMNIDLAESFWKKLEKVKKKYPADKVKGKSGYQMKNNY